MNAARATLAVLLVGCAHAPAAAPHWSYIGDHGPQAWSRLSPAFAACGGTRQSPIDLTAPSATSDAPLAVDWHAGPVRAGNTGHTVRVDVAPGSTLALDGRSYALAQIHFHHPSEHTLDGKRFPLEIHFVHVATGGDLAVIAVFVVESDENRALADLFAHLPPVPDSDVPAGSLDPNALLPTARMHYRYDGSLTTPPCSEGVKWLVLATPIAMSRAQIDAFATLFPSSNRPLQPRNGRPLVADTPR